MEVTYGLLNSLVKTKSIERILAPIASQISLLIILNEAEDDSSHQHEDMLPCAQAVMDAASRLALVAKQQAQSSTDQEFIAQTLSSCEVLELSSSNLFVATEKLQTLGPSKETRAKLVRASKDVLQGTMKVLLVADDAEVRRLITSTQVVTEKLSHVSQSRKMPDLVNRFKEFTDAISIMTSLANKRQRDLTQACQRERIVTALSILKKSLSSLNVVMQNFVKYPDNPQAEVGKSYIVDEILSALQDLGNAVQNRDVDDSFLETDESGYFVSRIDQALEAVNEDNRDELHSDLEMWTEAIVRHSMTVAHLCHDNHRDVIIKTCQRLILVKGRVMELYQSQKANPDLPTIRSDYSDVCETLIDEFCELEKNVNIALLHLVIEVFKETTEPLERLVKSAVYPLQGDSVLEASKGVVVEFEDHADKMCQIANLAAGSSTDAKRVHVIRSCVSRLEKLDPEIVPACINISRHPRDKMCVKHLKMLMKEWNFELTNLLEVLDEMTDPKMFMLVSERKVEEDINTCNGCVLISDPGGLSTVVQSLVGRSRRVAQVAERIVDSHNDPVFRNGLMVYIKQLRKAITAVSTASSTLQTDFSSKSYHGTLKRRFDLLQDTLAQVTAGLSDINHPHVLSPLRRNVRQGDNKKYDKDLAPTNARLSGSHGNKFIVTSAPTLHSGNKPTPGNQYSAANNRELIAGNQSEAVENREPAIEEQNILPQQAMKQKTELSRSFSLSQGHPVGPQTYARKLATDLVSWATKGDKSRVNLLCGDLLGWTNHIVDVSQHVTPHCSQENKKRELETLCYRVDELAPDLIDKVKYVLHGDFSHIQDMKTHAEEWANKVEQLRIYIDMTVDQWKTLCDKVVESTRKRQTDLVRHQLEVIQVHSEALCSLITITESLRWESQVKGQEKITAVWEEKDVLDNLTVTFKTTSEMVSEQGLTEELHQLEQLGREWSVKVYHLLSTLESLSEELLALGQERKIWPQAEPDDLPLMLQEETGRLKDLLKSACYGDDDKKALYKDFLSEMKDCVEEIKSSLLGKKPVSAIATVTKATGLYNRHKVDLLRGKWILKAVQCSDLIRQQTIQYGTVVESLIEKAFTVKALPEGDERSQQLSEFQSSIIKLSDSVGAVRKKVLVGIQLSSELSQRSVVRQCLDAINQQIPSIIEMLSGLPGAAIDLESLSKLKLSWCCRVRHLITALEQMSDVKPTLVTDILKLLEVELREPNQSEVAITSTSFTSAQNLPLETLHVAKKPGHVSHAPPRQKSSTQADKSGEALDMVSENVNFEPAEVDLDQLEKQIQDKLRVEPNTALVRQENAGTDFVSPVIQTNPLQSSRKTRIQALKSDTMYIEQETERWEDVNNPVVKCDTMFIEKETERWEDVNNPVVKVASTMATQLKHMTDYVSYQGPITSHAGQVETAKALARNSEKILKFAVILCEHCFKQSFTENLKSYCSQLPTVIKQLTVISDVQLGATNFDSSDAMLVKAGQNLMRIILKMMGEAEAVCVKGLTPPTSKDSDQESAFLLAMNWKKTLNSQRELEIRDADQDELGLRVIEDVRQPTLSHLFRS